MEAGKTSFSGFLPGQKLTFAIELESVQNVNLKITKIKSNNINMQNASKHRYICGGTTEINVCESIDIYCKYYTADEVKDSDYTIFIDNFDDANNCFPYDEINSSTVANNSTGKLAYDSISSNVRTLKAAKQITMLNVTSSTLDSPTDIFVFYTVYFSTEDEILYKEYDTTTKSNELIVPGTTSTRYFDQNASGTNNCYAELDFALNELALTFS